MLAYLKVKVKSLAEEAKIIRHEEHLAKCRERAAKERNKPFNSPFWGLRLHRTQDVRNEARCAHLAYGFLLGRSYEQMEPKNFQMMGKPNKHGRVYSDPNWDRIKKLALKYCESNTGDKIETAFNVWKAQAQAGPRKSTPNFIQKEAGKLI